MDCDCALLCVVSKNDNSGSRLPASLRLTRVYWHPENSLPSPLSIAFGSAVFPSQFFYLPQHIPLL